MAIGDHSTVPLTAVINGVKTVIGISDVVETETGIETKSIVNPEYRYLFDDLGRDPYRFYSLE